MLKDALKELQKPYLLITAGAGMGVDSGLPDFRGVEGFWRAYPIAKRLNLRFEELANPKWFEENPKLAWAFYGHRYYLYKKTAPHLGFSYLLEIAKSKKDYFIVTSNVDGQFQKAGFNHNKIYEIHGSIEYLQCINFYCPSGIWKAKLKFEIDIKKFEAKEPLPRCPKCQAIARPNILMFGDFSFKDERVNSQKERFLHFLGKIKTNELAIIEIGAGKAVPTIRNLSEALAREYQAKLIRINPRDYEEASIFFKSGAKKALESLFKALKS